MKKIFHKVIIKTPADKVYDAITTQKGLAAWWTPEAQATPEIGSTARFPFEPTYFKEMTVTDLQPGKIVKWTCRQGNPEWIGTTITFDLQPHEKGTALYFTHDGWKDLTPTFADCNFNWAVFLLSLKLLCETGKGRPYPDHQR